MGLFTGKKVGVSSEERELPYYHFFEQEMAAIPEEKLAKLENPSEVPIVPFEKKDMYLAGVDDDYCHLGYGVTADGIGFVANETYMPGVTSEMIDWWFAWSGVGSDLRYKNMGS